MLLAVLGFVPRLAAQTNEWTWMGGTQNSMAPGVCATPGVPAAGNMPSARQSSATWTDPNGNFWLFGGQGIAEIGYGYLNDLWEYTPSTGEWTCIPETAGPQPRQDASAWTDSSGNLWLYGGIGETEMADIWKFTPSTGAWTYVGDAGGAPVYGTLGVPAAGNKPGARMDITTWTDSSGNFWLFSGWVSGALSPNDLWRYTPSTGEWTWMAGGQSGDAHWGKLGVPAAGNVPGWRIGAVSWTDLSGNLWLFGGTEDYSGVSNDLWKYTPSTGQWTWMSGSQTDDSPGVFGTRLVPAAGNAPPARQYARGWTDLSGSLWLYGGSGLNVGETRSDLWKYTPSTGLWTWMGGDQKINGLGSFGIPGVASPANWPSSRDLAMSWTDLNGDFWLFGGYGTSVSNRFWLNDLWRYAPAPFGTLEQAHDSGSSSTTVPQRDSLYVSGWSIDPQQGAPVTQVQVLMDGTVVGNAKLGIARAGIASRYPNIPNDLDSGWTFTMPASGLSPGTHTVTAVAANSQGISQALAHQLTITVPQRESVWQHRRGL